MPDFKRWLQGLGLEKYEQTLRGNDVDLNVAPELTEQDLEKLGLSLGHRRKFIAAAAKLRAGDAPPAGELPPAQSPGEEPQAVERRQVTVVFSDLVGSTALAAELDPEDMKRLLGEYRERCTAVIARYDGHVAQFLGDGILVYFGYPVAQEHAAERAVRAGLELVAEVGRLKRPDGLALEARVGIATGLVVAETPAAGVEQTVVGDTPNLAARLQGLADPGTVLVGASTYGLTRDFFEYAFSGEHALKGIREPAKVWKALGASAVESRFAAAHAAAAAPVVGRERELTLLADPWQRATRGNGHMVLISGEGGMGKSRLMEALADRVRPEPHRLLRAQCSPYHRNSMLYPIVQLLRHRLDLRREHSVAENLQRIDRMLARIGHATRHARLLLAELLELRAEETLSPEELTPTQRKNATLEILESFLLASIDGATALLLLEDAHWSDPSTQALVGRLLERIEHEHALVLVTQRPELKTTWADHPHATLLHCKSLGAENCAALARSIASRSNMDEALIREITSRCDGVPLYVEELTKAVLELRSASGASAVPVTLQDSLMARLDRLGGAKEIAQTASVIGRQFPPALLAAIAGIDAPALHSGLERLRESGMIFAAGEEEELAYSFNHALVQEAAYESLSKARRQALHGKIAHALESESAGEEESDPTVVASHYSRAGAPQKSFEFWMRAADRASKRLAFAEAVGALESALAEAERIPDPALQLGLKLDAQLKLATTVVHQKSPASNEAASALAEALRLAQQAKAGPQLFQATWGLFLNAARTRQIDKAKILGGELLAISENLGDEDLKFEALHHRWGIAYFLGETENILTYTKEGLRLYQPELHHKFSDTFAGHDPGVCANCVQAMWAGVAGDSAKVKPALQAAFALADILHHPMTHVFAQGIACHALYFTRDADACQACAEELVRNATKYDLPANRAIGSFWLGATQAMRGDPAAGLRLMEPGFGPTHGIGFFIALPGAIMADALARAGRDQDALALITRLLGEMSNPESGFFVSDLWRIRGELLARQRGSDGEPAERSLQTALRIASEQKAGLLRARAGNSLARLLGEKGRRDEAKFVLGQADASSLADRELPEVAVAERLLAELG